MSGELCIESENAIHLEPLSQLLSSLRFYSAVSTLGSADTLYGRRLTAQWGFEVQALLLQRIKSHISLLYDFLRLDTICCQACQSTFGRRCTTRIVSRAFL